MATPTPVASSAASGGVAGAAVVILTWALGLAHVTVPAEVAAALMVVVGPALHFAMLRFGAAMAPTAEAPSTAAPAITTPVEAAPHA